MARLTKKMEKDFTVVHNEFIRDKSLGLTARGLLLTMLSMSDSFSFSIKGLASIVPDGETKVSSALKELERCGYLRRQRIFADKGKLRQNHSKAKLFTDSVIQCSHFNGGFL